jgi:hypothetical protein
MKSMKDSQIFHPFCGIHTVLERDGWSVPGGTSFPHLCLRTGSADSTSSARILHTCSLGKCQRFLHWEKRLHLRPLSVIDDHRSHTKRRLINTRTTSRRCGVKKSAKRWSGRESHNVILKTKICMYIGRFLMYRVNMRFCALYSAMKRGFLLVNLALMNKIIPNFILLVKHTYTIYNEPEGI